MEQAEWERRYKARIVERCLRMNSLPNPPADWEPWTQAEAERAAKADLDGSGYEYLVESFEDDPEGSADESISNWD